MATDGVHIPKDQLVQIGAPAAKAPKMELEAVRQKLSEARGPQYWRSLEELTDQEGFQELMEREFPRHVSEWTDAVSRRGFLKLMSASLALAGLSACTKQPDEAIVPYVQQPEELIPGVPQFYATARPSNLGAQPLLVKSHMYRPIKVEGNPEHPASLGRTDAYSQGSLLDLYDPDRSQTITYLGGTRTWGDFLGALRDAAAGEKAKQGAGLRFLTETVISPTLAAQFRDVLRLYPQAKWYQYEPANRDAARIGSQLAFGQFVDAQYQLAEADVIVSLDADFLGGGYFPNFVKLAHDFAGRRKLDGKEMNRLYAVESQMSPTGGKADNRLALRAWEVEQFAGALAAAVGVGGANGAVESEAGKRFLAVLAADLKGHAGRCVVIPGEQQSPAVHALAAAMNQALGAVGKTVIYTDTVEPAAVEQTAGIKELTAEMASGKVSLLIILGGNPVFNVPADVNFKAAMEKVAQRIQLSGYKDETTRYCHWHVPMAHYLESWGDARAFDGTVSVVQPLIEPLYGGKTAHDILGAFSETPGQTSYDIVKAYWKSQSKSAAFDADWRRILHDGFVPNTAFAAKSVSAKAAPVHAPQKKDQIEIVFRPDPTIYDGRYVNNGWLQELPKPITKLTWDNAVIVSYNFAQEKKLRDQQVVEVKVGERAVSGGVKIVPGHPDGSITVHMGYGREFTGRVGTGTGFNAYAIRTVGGANTATATLTPTNDKHSLAVTQHHHLIEGKHVINADLEQGQSLAGEHAKERGVVRTATLEEFEKNPNFANVDEFAPPDPEMTLFGENGYSSWTKDPSKISEHQWGMTIDLNSCVGCNTCVIACQAENNIPVVGKEQVLMGREMHWLRIDAYFQSEKGDVANPRLFFQPVPCMQCENAPCEPVCPVGATVHSPEGLNNMVYNRCVGTRYCSNNCPYKVRRFNFLLFADFETESLKPMRNPDVSVRSRGVMEKCTYCVQRITAARIHAEKESRKVRDGEVTTACQQACPTDAIVFGDINDPNSRVSRIKKQQRNYAMLAEVNTRPRTTYIAGVLNPNAQLENKKSGEKKSEHGG